MRVPRAIKVIAAIDIVLAIAYLFDRAVGQPYRPLTSFIDLNGEQNLPTWYSSILWFHVAVLLGLFAWCNFSFSRLRSWLLLMLPLIFLGFSLDEAVQIHEWLGQKSDSLLPGGSRAGTPFSQTGIWTFVIGLPFLAFFVALILSLRVYFLRAPGAFAKLLLGMMTALAGSTGIEVLQNFAVPGSFYGALQIVSEELCEMMGATIILWGSLEILQGAGLVWRLDRAETDPAKSLLPAQAKATRAGQAGHGKVPAVP